MASEIIVVSGLPRSGTSLMMQMLDNGGVAAVTDHVRSADTDNPKGYYEYEMVKKIKYDTSWLPATRPGVQDGVAVAVPPPCQARRTGSFSWNAIWRKSCYLRKRCSNAWDADRRRTSK